MASGPGEMEEKRDERRENVPPTHLGVSLGIGATNAVSTGSVGTGVGTEGAMIDLVVGISHELEIELL
jgi:hypothetical protein